MTEEASYVWTPPAELEAASNLTAFLRSPQSVVPGGAMPDMGLTSRQARDVCRP